LRNNTNDGAELAVKASMCTIFDGNVADFFSRQTISSDAFKFPLRDYKPVPGTLL
jgi:hypothetical protein